VVFHCARRERVLLRDIFRLGTATSALLSIASTVGVVLQVVQVVQVWRR
jgi:hypothetical protein